MSTVARTYLRAADEAGALHGVEGAWWVGGEQADPLRGHTVYLVPYCAPALAGSPAFTRELLSEIRAEAPAAREVLMRLPAGVTPAGPWRAGTTYVRHDGSRATPDPAGLAVDHARGTDEAAVLGWLTGAIAEAASSWNWPRRPDACADAARLVFATPGRVTFVARDEHGPIGHATLLTEEHDEVTGEDVAELFDVLVEAGHPRHRQAVRLLTAHATGYARERGLPLIGNVVHPSGERGAEHAARVLASLAREGWRPDHVFWTRDVVRSAGRAR